MAAQEQALTTNSIKVKVVKQEGYVTYTICKDREESIIADLTSECSKLTQLDYKKTHDKVVGAVHWSLYHQKYDVLCSEQCYWHMTENVKTTVIQIVCGLVKNLRKTRKTVSIEPLRKAALLVRA